MNMEPTFDDPETIGSTNHALPANSGLEDLETFASQIKDLDATLGKMVQICDANTKKRINLLRKNLADIEPSVTMIGQVKAGKTSLLNAMVGWPDLLPADVNPWTSVVTSLHLSAAKMATETSAKFKFFEEDEWSNFLSNGGRLGELASRAGANEELAKVREQLEMMREKSRTRLGKKFELLLGQEHEYNHFDQEMIEKYVCLGEFFDEDDEESQADTQGRFADITKSADLFMHRPEFPVNLCLRDTPGVNDTFMMREQITIRAIRDSRLCVVVLSAHQALSSVDMALIRMITNIKSREVIVFVNRIDELPHPDQQIPEIKQSILRTLQAHSGPEDAQIIFGSAHWAEKALIGALDEVEEESAKSLLNWAEANPPADTDAPKTELQLMWDLSGVPGLFRALSSRILEGEGKETFQDIVNSAYNIANGIQLGKNAIVKNGDGELSIQMDAESIKQEIENLEKNGLERLDTDFGKVLNNFQNRLDTSHNSFLDRATSSLVTHLETLGENEIWEYQPTGLRMMLNSAYVLFGSRTQKLATKAFTASAADISGLYDRVFNGQVENNDIQTPASPRIPPPVFLGQTIALDLKGPWWKSWWTKRKGRQAFAESFHHMIKAETDPMVNELKTNQPKSIHDDITGLLRAFFADQRAILSSIANQSEMSGDTLADMMTGEDALEKKKVLESALAHLIALRPEQEKCIKPMNYPITPNEQAIETTAAPTQIESPKVKPRIALMGEFSSGKSTLTNLLLGSSPMPTKVTATQLPPVWVSYGDEQHCYEDLDGNHIPFELHAISEIDLSNTRVIRLFLKSEILELCDLIDMPGISDPNMSSDVWSNVIDEADSVIWCTPATQAWRQSEAAVWETLPKALYDKSLLLMTRNDKLVTTEDRAKVLKRIQRETAGFFAGVHPISLTQAMCAQDDQNAWEASGADAFVTQFVDILSELPKTRAEPSPSGTEIGDTASAVSAALESHVDQEDIAEPEAPEEPPAPQPEFFITKPKQVAKTPRPPRQEQPATFQDMIFEAESPETHAQTGG